MSKHRPYSKDSQHIDDSSISSSASSKRYSFPQAKVDESASSTTTVEEKKLEITLSKQAVEKQWNLLGRYLGQYIIYTGSNTAWLLSNSASSKIAKSIITRLTSRQNLGGVRLIRGYSEVEKQKQSKTKTATTTTSPKNDDKNNSSDNLYDGDIATGSSTPPLDDDQPGIIDNDTTDDEEEEIRKIDHIVFAIHGIGQKMTEKTGHNFVDDINNFRKTLKTSYATGIAATSTPSRSNGILVLPILWRQDLNFGVAGYDDETIEADLGLLGVDDGIPTLDDLTLEGIPNIRSVVSDVLMDIPLYLTPKYRYQMINIITREMNRVYGSYIKRNPTFSGKVSIVGHSLGSMLAFDLLTSQPFECDHGPIALLSNPTIERKPPPLNFKVQNFFAVGSPLGIILLLKGFKIDSRKSLASSSNRVYADVSSSSHSPIPICYPNVENLYNIFHKADPVAYRIEPLICKQYSIKLKPEPIPYVKGGLKGVFDAGYNVGSGIANRAGAMYESIKYGITANLFMRGLGLSRQQLYQDTHPPSSEDNSDNDENDIYDSYMNNNSADNLDNIDHTIASNSNNNNNNNNNVQEKLPSTSNNNNNNSNDNNNNIYNYSKNIDKYDINKNYDNRLQPTHFLTSTQYTQYSKSIPDSKTTTTTTSTTSTTSTTTSSSLPLSSLPPHSLGIQHAKHLKEFQLDTTESTSNNSGNSNNSNRIRSNSDPAFAFSSSPALNTLHQRHQTSSSGLSRSTTPAPLPLISSSHSYGARKLKYLNVNGRVDYALQEGLLENPYLNAFNAHMQYWQDIDVGAFIVREIYK
ncbi:unnamed protein product [Cunninghamella blakesleeana]